MEGAPPCLVLAPRDNHLDKAWSIAFQLLHGRLTLDDVAKQIADAAGPALEAHVEGLLRQVTFRARARQRSRAAAPVRRARRGRRSAGAVRAFPGAARHGAHRHRVHGSPHVLAVGRCERPRGRADGPRRHAATAAQRRSARAAPHRAARNAADAARRSRGCDCGAAHPAPSRAAHGACGRRRCRGTLSARAQAPAAEIHHDRHVGRVRSRRPHRHRLEPQPRVPLRARAGGLGRAR